MTRPSRNTRASRILALLLCVSVAIFFSALLVHSHGTALNADHAVHCQVCALGHTTASIATAITTLTLALLMLMLMRVGTPNRGSPRFVTVHTTRPPPTCL